MRSKDKDIIPLTEAQLNERLEQCYDALYQRSLELCMEHDSQIVASTMMAQALRLYKTILLPEDFEAMIGTIVATANQIEPYKTGNLH